MTCRRTLVGALTALLVLSASAAAAQTGPQVTAAASATTSGAIEVVWTPVEAAVGYLVVPQRLTSTGTWRAVDGRIQRVTAARPVVFDGLVNGTTYRGCVAAVLADGFRTAVSDPAVPYGLPGVPVVTDTARSGTELTVTWAPPASNGRPITGYTVGVTPATVQPIVVGGNQTTLTIEGLDATVDYTVTVRATNLRGQGEQGESETIPASLGLGPVGAEVTLVSATAGPCAGASDSPPAQNTTTGGDATGDSEESSDAVDPTSSGGTNTQTPVVPGPIEQMDAEAEGDGVEGVPDAGREDATQVPEAAAPEPTPESASPQNPPSRSAASIWWTLAGLLALIGGATTVPAIRARLSGATRATG